MSHFPQLLVLALLCAGCARGGVGTPPGQPVEVVRAHPHDPEAYTQGFLFHDGDFFESTGLYGSSSLRRVDVDSGEVIDRNDLPTHLFAEGIAIIGPRIYQLTWKDGIIFVYDLATFEEVGRFSYEGEGWGLTSDGSHLILSDGTHLLRFFDPATFELVREVEVSYDGTIVLALNELEWVRGEVWANIYQDDRIARIDPQTGQVIGWLSTRSLLSWWNRTLGADVANGIAYDSVGDRLWLTGKRWPFVFQVERPE